MFDIEEKKENETANKMEEEVKENEEKLAINIEEENSSKDEIFEETISTKLDKPANLHDVEEARIKFYNIFKKNRKISNIAMLVVLVIIIVAFVLIVQESQVMKIIGYVLAAASIIGMIIFYSVNKNKFPTITKEYVKDINYLLNGYTFEPAEFSQTVTDSMEKIDQSDVISDQVYLNVSKVASRNVVYGKYKNGHFKVSDLAVYAIKDKTKQEPVFVGKYLTYPNTLNFSNRIIISLSGEKPIDLASAILDLKELYKENNLVIYGPEGLDYNSILGAKFISKIKEIAIKDYLLNINFSIWGGHSAVYMSYSDSIIALPFDKPFDEKGFVQYRENLLDLLSILSLINK